MAICSIINAITQDEGFSLSEIGKNAQLCANKLLAWCKDREENRKAMCSFATELYSRLLQCTKHPRKVKYHTLRERMWERYYKLQISYEFTKLWTDFLRNTIGYKACPIFYQHISNEMMKLVIKAEFPTDSCKSIESKVAPLDHEERNALHYTAGYVIHAITKEVKRSSKDSILLSCLKEMSEGIIH